jgi:putative ABC transport system permease protein
MNLIENFREGLRSVKANLLRSVITAAIVTLGITALVGVLTAVDGIQASLSKSLSSLGANTFNVESKTHRGRRSEGLTEKSYPLITMSEAFKFLNEYRVPSTKALYTNVTQIAEVKRGSKKTTPNTFVMGINEEYFAIKSLEFEQGRGFSALEVKSGSQLIVLGNKVYKTLFNNRESIDNQTVSLMGGQFRVIGVLKEKGGFGGDPNMNFDNMVFVSIVKGNQLSGGRGLYYTLTVGIQDPTQVEFAMGEATGLLRRIRGDDPGQPDSFQLEKSDALSELNSLMGMARGFGFVVGIVTLLGAAIALMNIMLVSVTERTREIGVRKALGATPKRIKQQFVIEAIVVCLIGGTVGVILGILVGNFFSRFLGNDSFVIPWMWIIIGFGVCVMVGLIAGYYPARKASKMDPIESLRFE